jgi:hypothetical protein
VTDKQISREELLKDDEDDKVPPHRPDRGDRQVKRPTGCLPSQIVDRA